MVPRVYEFEGVEANDEINIIEPALQFFQGFYRIRDPAPPDLNIRYLEIFIAFNGGLEDLKTFGGLLADTGIFMGRQMGRDKVDIVEAEFFPYLFCNTQMPNMNGIESSTENANRHSLAPLRSQLPVTKSDKFCDRKFVKAHRTESMQPRCTYTHFRAKPKLETIIEARRRIDEDQR